MLPLLFLASFLAAQPATAVPCSDWKACRDLAEAAAARQDYETFHDLAWRTMQLRRTNDPDVMYMLARAQSLSGRPHDALVMLGRIADMGVETAASTSADFARVRALAGWRALEERLEKLRAEQQPSAREAVENTEPARVPPTAQPPVETMAVAVAKRETQVETVAQFRTPQFSPGGIAYDAVSRRYLVGNLPERKLTEIEEGSNRPATLSGAAAQLFDVVALEIDTRQGDLWVVSDAAENGGSPAATLHKLQLISGRVLKVFDTPAADLPTRFVDVAVSGRGVLVLDAAKPRVFTIGRAGSLQVLMPLPAGTPASVAPAAGGRTLYVAYDDRLIRVDARQKTVTPLTSRQADAVEGLRRIRWHRNSLVGVQSTKDGLRRVVRLPLERGTRVGSPEVLDEWRESPAGNASASLIGDDFYYLVPGDGESMIRRIRLR